MRRLVDQDIRHKNQAWTYIAPVAYLALPKELPELLIDRVTVVSKDRLVRARRRFGMPVTVGDLCREAPLLDTYLFGAAKSFAVMRRRGPIDENEQIFVNTVREELSVLCASWLPFQRQRHDGLPSFADQAGGGRAYFAISQNRDWVHQSQSIGSFEKQIDGFWRRTAEDTFFFRLLSIFHGNIKVTKAWRSDLWNASVLIGQSQAAKDAPTAFLFNMIALELLLTRQGDVVGDTLPLRAEAFLGWTGYWHVRGYEQKIREVYKIRCRVVHQGDRSSVTWRHVVFTDGLLLNLVRNVVGHTDLFKSKDDIVAFSERVQAERLLGIDASVRPRTLSFTERGVPDKEIADLL